MITLSKLLSRVTKYALVGGTAAFCEWIIFAILTFTLDVYFLVSASISFIFATFVNYKIGVKLLFRSGFLHSENKEIYLTYLVSGIGLILNLAILYFLVENLLMHPMISKILSTGIVFLWNFGARAYFIFEFKN